MTKEKSDKNKLPDWVGVAAPLCFSGLFIIFLFWMAYSGAADEWQANAIAASEQRDAELHEQQQALEEERLEEFNRQKQLEADAKAREDRVRAYEEANKAATTYEVGPGTEYYIKGNISSSGEKIYHMPGDEYYNETLINEAAGERWFSSPEEAEAAGWRRAYV